MCCAYIRGPKHQCQISAVFIGWQCILITICECSIQAVWGLQMQTNRPVSSPRWLEPGPNLSLTGWVLLIHGVYMYILSILECKASACHNYFSLFLLNTHRSIKIYPELGNGTVWDRTTSSNNPMMCCPFILPIILRWRSSQIGHLLYVKDGCGRSWFFIYLELNWSINRWDWSQSEDTCYPTWVSVRWDHV